MLNIIKKYYLYAGYGGYLDIKIKYKGSILGPIWSTISILGFALILNELGKTFAGGDNLGRVKIDYIICNLTFWYYFSTVLSESCTLYTDNANNLKETTIPAVVYNLRLMVKNLIVALHNYLGYVIFILIYSHDKTNELPISLAALVFFTVPLLFLSISVSYFSARYSDLKSMLALAVQLLFFATPIFWYPIQDNILTFFVPYNLTALFMLLARGGVDFVVYTELIIHVFLLYILMMLAIKKLKEKIIYYI
jgi:lipopolysaccharide transport system permease protein